MRMFVAFALLALLVAGFVLQLLGVLLGEATLVVAGVLAGVVLEVRLRRSRRLARALAHVGAGFPTRQLVRDALLLGGLGRTGALDGGWGATLVTAVLACWALHFLLQALGHLVRRARHLPLATRNIDVSALALPPSPPALLGRHGSPRLAGVSALVSAGSAASALTGTPLWGALAALAACAGLAAAAAHLATWLRPGRRPPGEDEVMAWLDAWLAAYRPTVGLYFSGGPSSVYQANMWVPALEALPGRPLIVLRERALVQRVAATHVPVLCLPRVAALLRLEHSTLDVLLHPANSGKTSQVLRIPTVKHAFTNHGESDKLSSCNPYAKAYDEVWVAGPAARERYRLADVGVADADVVEVGRPQLAPVQPWPGPPARGERVTVLYAPTWEGWADAASSTSLITAGEAIVGALLADGRVRVLYRPHPMTGTVDARAAAADLRVRALLRAAGAGQDQGQGPSAGTGEADAGAGRRLEACRAEVARCVAALGGGGAAHAPAGDELDRMRAQPPADPAATSALATARTRWEAAYWACGGPGEHRVLADGPHEAVPSLYSCFNQAHLLVTDVSSVVADYLAGGGPYAVVNLSELPEAAFRAEHPTVAAATVLPADGSGVAALLADVRDPRGDVRAPARRELRERLLGPDEPPSAVRFAAAVADLAARASARRAGTQGDAPGYADGAVDPDGADGARCDGGGAGESPPRA